MAPVLPRPPQFAEAFDKLYRDHIDVVYRYAYRLCGEAETAKDLVQETFLNAYRGIRQFRSNAKISTMAVHHRLSCVFAHAPEAQGRP
jgi:RNA polymerase sigma factor (sigma-70 family)